MALSACPPVAAAPELGARPPAAPGPVGVVDERVDTADGAAADDAVTEGSGNGDGALGPAAARPDAPVRSGRDPIVLAAAVVVLVPSIVAAISALRHPYIPTNDWALIELRVREVGTGDTPLLGPWSRFGWRHPGPLMFYVLALPYRLVPADRGLLFATACVNLAATIGYALVVLRHRRMQAVVALVGLAVLQRGMGIDQLSDPWNPTILIVPFALYLVLCLEIATGRPRWPIPVAAGVATFVVQSHVGLAQPVLLLGVVAFGLRWYLGRRDRAESLSSDSADSPSSEVPDRPVWRRVPWRAVVPTAAVLGVLWLPPLVDQVNGEGNLGLLLRWARGEDIGGGMGILTEGRLSTERILGGAAWLLDPTGFWVGRFRPIVAYGSPLLGQGRAVTLLWVPLVLGLALVAAWRAPMVAAYRRPIAVAGILAATGIVALFTDLSTAEGAPVFWPFRWAAAIVMLIFITVGWVVAGVAAQRFPWLDEVPAGGRRRFGSLGALPAPARLAGAAMVAAVAVPVALAAWRGPVGRQPMQPASDALLRLRPTIEEEAGRESLVVANTDNLLNDKDLGLPVVLERAGIDWVELDDPRAAGRFRYAVLPVGAIQDGAMESAIAMNMAELLARSGPPEATELVLVRWRTEEDPGS